jgi:hypothetical protein
MTPNWMLTIIFLAIVALCLPLRNAHGAACHPDCGPNGEDWEYQSDIVCGKYRGELWNGHQSYLRLHPERMWRDKTRQLIVKSGDFYYKGKKCRLVKGRRKPQEE